MCTLVRLGHILAVPIAFGPYDRSPIADGPIARSDRSPIAETDRKVQSQLSDADVMELYRSDRSSPIALIAPIAVRSRDQRSDRSSQKSDRNRSK